MKRRDFYGLISKHLCLTVVAVICTTILLWAWEKAPLNTFLSPQNMLWIPSPENPITAPVVSSTAPKPDTYLKELSYTAPEKEIKNEQADQNFDAKTSVRPVARISPNNTNRNSAEAPVGKKEIDVTIVKDDTKSKQHSEGEKRVKQPGQSVNIMPAMTSALTSSSGKGDNNSVLTTSPTKKEACDYAKGKWVADSRRPLYSGFDCKQWLSVMWACRVSQRMDFSYEKFRWQPENCEMPEFDNSNFLRRMQDKTIALIGDSLGRQQFQSLMCMVTGGKESPDVINVGWEYGLVKARGAKRPDGWAYRFLTTNTTILFYWSATLSALEPLNITNPSFTDYAMHLDRPVAFLSRYLHRFHVLVLNTGHHWNMGKFKGNRWIMHIRGIPNTDKNLEDVRNAKNFTIHSVVKWLNSQLPKYPDLKAFFRTISPRHFVNGDWNTGGTCDNTTPLSRGMAVSQNVSSDPVIEVAVKGTGVKLLDITAISELRDEGHISKYGIRAIPGMEDCLHWCLPGIPDTWNEILIAQL